MITFFDTETTGKDPKSARLVQLAALLCDDDMTERASLSVIRIPESFEIPPEATSIHGISQAIAVKCGVPIHAVMRLFLHFVWRSQKIVGHNVSYDLDIIRTEMRHSEIYFSPKVFDEKEHFCTMKATTNICKISGPYGYKWPRLHEAYSHFFPGERFDAHTAMGDVRACMRIYAALQPGAPAS